MSNIKVDFITSALKFLFNILYSIRGVSKKLGEWYQKTNKTEDTKN
jgi:hypothetical protein